MMFGGLCIQVGLRGAEEKDVDMMGSSGAESLHCAEQVNQKVSKTAHIKELNQEIDRLKAELFCTREKNGVYMPAELFQQREQVHRARLLRSLLTRCSSTSKHLPGSPAPPSPEAKDSCKG